MNGCSNCKYCYCYKGDRWTPDEYECHMPEDKDYGLTDEQAETIFTRVWENGEEWNSNEEPVCPAWEEAPTEEDEYWDRYAYEESHYDKDGEGR